MADVETETPRKPTRKLPPLGAEPVENGDGVNGEVKRKKRRKKKPVDEGEENNGE